MQIKVVTSATRTAKGPRANEAIPYVRQTRGSKYAIVYNATAAQVQSALAGVLGAGSVNVTGSGTSGNPFLVTFTGALAGQAALPLTADWSQITGGAAYDQSDVGVSSVATGQSGTNQTETIGYADSGAAPVNDGGYRLDFNGQLTGSIAFDATAADMQNSLAALANIGAGNVVVTGGPAASGVNGTGAASYQVMFVGALGGRPQPDITVVSDGLYDQNGQAVPTFAAVTTPGAAEVDDVQQIVTAPGGTFTLSYNGNATAAQNAGEPAATLQTALQAVAGLAQVTVTGVGTAASPYLVTFGGDLKGENVPPLTAVRATLNSVATTYDNAGQITAVGDNYSHYAYTYDGQGNTASVDNAGSPYSPRVVLASQYDAAGNRESLAATLYNGSTAEPDFINNYSYDALSRLTVMQQQQQNQPGANAVAAKEIDYAYNGLGEVTSRADFNFIGVGPRQDMATGNFTYDSTTGLLTSLNYTSHGGATAIDNFNWTYDTLARVKTFSSIDGTATYGYDSRSEVTSASYTTNAGGHQPANESFSFDANGNRPVANGGTIVNNEVSDDGTFKYTFDADGNRLTRTRDSAAAANDYQASYSCDYRNRLAEVRDFNNSGTLTEQIDYTYDVFDHLIQRVDDVVGGATTATQYIWDGDSIALSFVNGALATRYLNGPNTNAADQYFTTLAEEHVTSLASPGTLTFDLPDNLGTLRDIADANGNPAGHLVYTVFGQLAYESAPTVAHLDGYAGGLYDPSTQLVYFIHRWYDPAATVWISADPLGFAAGDANLTRYVKNSATDQSDPSGLVEPVLPPAPIGAEGLDKNPAGKSNLQGMTGIRWDNWNILRGDLPSVAQKVTDEGTLVVVDACGRTHMVSWSESYIEVWTFGRNGENHRTKPMKPAKHLEEGAGLRFVVRRGVLMLLNVATGSVCEVESWEFNMKATFEAVNGFYPDPRMALNNFYRSPNRFDVSPASSKGKNAAFKGMLYPGDGVEIPGLAFPPPVTNGPTLVDVDTWKMTWSRGDKSPKSDFQCSKYQPKAP